MSIQDDLEQDLDRCEKMAQMVFDREWAEHVGKGEVSSKVEAAFTQLHNDLSREQEALKNACGTIITTEDNLHKAAAVMATMQQTPESVAFLEFYNAIYDESEPGDKA